MFIGYLRVSTERQHASGLGLEAQREAIERYAAQQGIAIAQVFVETESGKLKDRPQLNAALAQCRRQKATLLIAKLDRLARNVAFVSALMETGVEFVAVDAPYANRLMVHVMSAFAQFEREQISERTKAALAAAKARGTKLGKNGIVLAAENRAVADAFALAIKPHVDAARTAGCATYRAVGGYLNERGVPAPGGGFWHPTSVKRLLDRLEPMSSVTGCAKQVEAN
jgi:DNA invertase Pin-like site-specific DNA recombinase